MKLPAIFRQFMDDDGVSGNSKKKHNNNNNNKKNLQKNSNLKNGQQQQQSFNNSFEEEVKNGLSFKVVEKRLKRDGENCLVSQTNVSAMKIFAGQFKDFLVLVLLVSTLISIFMGEITEAIVIASILFLNAFMGFLQEFKTEKTLAALDNMVSPSATVLREGKLIKISANLLVKGDIVFLKTGNSVPADCVVLQANRFEVNESILTGESVAVEKTATNSLESKKGFHKSNMVFMGTSVLKGMAKVRVVETGMATQMGKISSMINNVQKEPTPIQKRLSQMGKIIVFGCLSAAFFVVLIGILRGEQVFDMVVTGLSLAVASVPEGLPAIVTIALSFAVKHMVKRKALVRKLHAVETLGCANLICTDKTGTITQNRMTVKKLAVADCEFDVEGEEGSTNGSLLSNGLKLKPQSYSVLEKMMQSFVLCNDANLLFDESEGASVKIGAVGEPTEVALLLAAAKFKIFKKNILNSTFELYDEIAFDSSKKYMAVFAKLKSSESKKYVFVKGAYDVVLKKCSKCELKNGEVVSFSKVKQFFDLKNEEFAKEGMRVLSFAYGEISNGELNVESGLTFLGLAAMVDPPRKQAKAAVAMCRRAGIKTVMITGDQKLTAIAIAKQVGIYRENDRCVQGSDLDGISDDELKRMVDKVTIFARVTPKHKLKIVKAFKSNGNIVAMTGDGVNDAPAIKEANIGVAMGKNGSDVAKQAADLVLLDDNFATLVSAIEEGRIIYSNMRKFIRYLLSCNFGEVLTSLFAMLIGMPVPLLPMQILLINLVTDGLPAIALGLEPAEPGAMDSAPRSIKETLFSNGLVYNIIVRGVLIALATLTVFTTIFKATLSIELARTGTFLALIWLQLVHVFECKSEKKSIFRINYFNNRKLLLAVSISLILTIGSVWFAPVGRILKNYPLTLKQLGVVAFFTLIVPVVNGIACEVRNFFKKRKSRLIYKKSS